MMNRFLSNIYILIFGLCIALTSNSIEVSASDKLTVVKGAILKDGAFINKGMITTYSITTNKVYHSLINKGQFQLSLPPGEYVVHTYTDTLKKNAGNVYRKFTVKDKLSTLNLTIHLKEDNVKGSIEPHTGRILEGTIHFIKHDKESTKFFTVIKNNQFQLPLEDGKYTAFQYYDKSNSHYGQMAHTFLIAKGKATVGPLRIETNPFNVRGSIQIDNQKKINGNIKMECQSCSLSTTYTAVVKEGKYQMFLPDGRYKVVSIYHENSKKLYRHSYVFEVKSGKVSTSATLVVSTDNISGLIEKGGKPITEGSIFIEPTNTKGFHFNPSLKDGAFRTYIMDGAYQINRYYDGSLKQIVALENPVSFVVSGGKSSLPQIQVNLKEDNFIGIVTKGGKEVVKGTIVVHQGNRQSFIPVLNGHFFTNLTEGSYTIQAIKDELTKREHVMIPPLSINVEKGKILTPLRIDIPVDNVSGTIRLNDGTLMKEGFMKIESANPSSTQSYDIPIANGRISLFMPDGQYRITLITNQNNQKYVDIIFTVKGRKLASGPITIQLES